MELKLCPFCGEDSAGKIIIREGYVVCKECGTEGPYRGGEEGPKRAEAAAIAWNTRKLSADYNHKEKEKIKKRVDALFKEHFG